MKYFKIAVYLFSISLVFFSCSPVQKKIPQIKRQITVQNESSLIENFFKDREGCFILRDLSNNKDIYLHNSALCDSRVSPNSTFKIPLALMAFDSGVLSNEDSVREWDGNLRSLTSWNQNHTAKTWLRDSVVWYSQKLTKELGFDKIRQYLSDLSYGNQDFSGGLEKAWLNSTLKISPTEQLEFLTSFYRKSIPISKQAIDKTFKILPTEHLLNEYVFAKTGSGFSWLNPAQKDEPLRRTGWYIGYLNRGELWYAFVIYVETLDRNKEIIFSGLEAKQFALKYFEN